MIECCQSMSGEKDAHSKTANGSSLPFSYPKVPPPAYTESAGPSAPPPLLYQSTFTDPIVGTALKTNSGFVKLPTTRYDTMTSYVEDGSAVQTVITTGAILDNPILVKCPFCKATVTSKTRPVAGCLTWLCCLAIGATLGFCGCCLIPFMSKRLCDVQHYCPKCQNLIALYKRL